MATKPVTILPAAAAAGCIATCESTVEDRLPPYYEIIYYQLSATAAAGWELVDFTWTEHWENATTGGGDDNPGGSSSNPYSGQTFFEGWMDLSALEIGEGRDVYSLLDITANFRRIRNPTNLLVNSYNRSSPVRLVYDPATNKLVADY